MSSSDSGEPQSQQVQEMIQSSDSVEKMFRVMPQCLGRSLSMSFGSLLLVTGFAFVAYRGQYANNTRLRLMMSMRVGGPVSVAMYMFT